MRIPTVLMLTLALAGCGGGGDTTDDTTDDTASSGGETAEAELPPWSEMTQEQKGHFMATVVVPRMEPLFQEIDGEEFADFGCATCHGANGSEVGFEMPNGIHPLNPAEIPAMMTSEDAHTAEVAQAMATVITPTMVELLGVPGYDPATHEGFGCFGCHGMAE